MNEEKSYYQKQLGKLEKAIKEQKNFMLNGEEFTVTRHSGFGFYWYRNKNTGEEIKLGEGAIISRLK